ncbi:hypothetical protein [Rhizobium sp. BR 315]|uniref:hypothetical protein n=1 Tax=Rhizobium sp. BR 315 TaxID=3040014 RepID=UPI003D34D452
MLAVTAITELSIEAFAYFTLKGVPDNAENVTFTESGEIARQLLANWDSRLKVSRAFESATENR